MPIDIDVALTKKEIEPPKILPPPKSMIQPPIKTLAFPPPVIVVDKLVVDPPVETCRIRSRGWPRSSL